MAMAGTPQLLGRPTSSQVASDCDRLTCWCRCDDPNPAGAMRWSPGAPIPRFPPEEAA